MIDVAVTVTELLPALNADSVEDLTFWTETDLYSYADEAAQRLARTAAAFVRDSRITTPALTAIPNPSSALVLVHVACDGRSLRPATANEIEALDAGWLQLKTAYYIDPEAGDDGNDGLTPATAWRSTGAADALLLEPGEWVLYLVTTGDDGWQIYKQNNLTAEATSISADAVTEIAEDF